MFELLPEEIVIYICLFLNFNDLVNFSRTNSSLFQLIDKSQEIWKNLFKFSNVPEDDNLMKLVSSAVFKDRTFITQNLFKLKTLIHYNTQSNWLNKKFKIVKGIPPRVPYNRHYGSELFIQISNFDPTFVILSADNIGHTFHFVIYDCLKPKSFRRFNLPIKDFLPKRPRKGSFLPVVRSILKYEKALLILVYAFGSSLLLCFSISREDLTFNLNWVHSFDESGNMI